MALLASLDLTISALMAHLEVNIDILFLNLFICYLKKKIGT